jgi:predicted HTH transcriptional regulator
VRTDYKNDLMAMSLRSIGNIWWLGVGASIVFLFIFLFSYVVSPILFRKYFIFFHKDQLSISEALKSGEGQKIEFKRGFIDDDILKSIAAFANTNDGTIFIGIDDGGKISGINVKTPKEKDSFRTKIFNLIRNKVKPYLLVDIDFEEKEIRDYVVAKIFVPRGEELFYFLFPDGVIYVRDGNADKKASPELIKTIASKYYAS